VIRSRCPCRWKFAICSMPEQVHESGSDPDIIRRRRI
jgi:hypothetical protein